ncbi:MAG: NhaA family Na+:H+ antiporter, partial [Candidatus Endobugula sp.]
MQNKYWSLVTQFFKSEPASGILLMFAAVLAMIFANTSLSSYYEVFLSTPLQV